MSGTSAQSLGLEYLPYIMNFLSLIYLSYCRRSESEKDFKVVNNLLDTAVKHQDLIKNPLHLGCIYNHFGQLHDMAVKALTRNPARHFKNAIGSYQRAQKYLGK